MFFLGIYPKPFIDIIATSCLYITIPFSI